MQWVGEDRKTHRVGFADLTEYENATNLAELVEKWPSIRIQLTSDNFDSQGTEELGQS